MLKELALLVFGVGPERAAFFNAVSDDDHSDEVNEPFIRLSFDVQEDADRFGEKLRSTEDINEFVSDG